MNMLIKKFNEKYLEYTTTTQELFETFHISKQHKKYLNIDLKHKRIYFNYPIKKQEINYNPVDIFYEDKQLLVAFKPPFLLVHDDGNQSDTLQARVNGYLQMNGSLYLAQAIHRIDYETSGLVLFCKHPFFQAYYDFHMANHTIQKEYIALVEGRTNFKNKKVTSYIARNRHDAKKMILHPNGKESISIFNTIKNYKNASLIRVQILTGRKHQIRLQCQALNHPIINDSLYGKKYDNRGLLLQSHRIQFHDLDIVAPHEKRFNMK